MKKREKLTGKDSFYRRDFATPMILFLFSYCLYMILPVYVAEWDNRLNGYQLSGFWGFLTIIFSVLCLALRHRLSREVHWIILKILFIFSFVFSSIMPFRMYILSIGNPGTYRYFGDIFLGLSQVLFLFLLFTGPKFSFPKDARSDNRAPSSKAGVNTGGGKDR